MPSKLGWTLIDKKTGRLIEIPGEASDYLLVDERKSAKQLREDGEKVVRARLTWGKEAADE